MSNPATPIWVPTGDNSPALARSFCDPSHAFGGGQIWLTQWTVVYDQDYACPIQEARRAHNTDDGIDLRDQATVVQATDDADRDRGRPRRRRGRALCDSEEVLG